MKYLLFYNDWGIYVSQLVYGIGFVTPTSAGWNFPLMVLAGCLVLAAFGVGKWSIDCNKGGVTWL